MIFKQKISFDNDTITNSILTKVARVKCLCVMLHENLTFNDHVNKVITQILKSVGASCPQKHCLSCSIIWCIPT